MGCGSNLMRIILVTFNVIFLLIGLAAIGLGTWLVIDSKNLFEFLKYDPEMGEHLLKSAAIVFIVCGCVIVLLSIFGIIGACATNKCMLGTYSTVLILILIAEIVAIVLIAVYSSKFENDFAGYMTDELQKKFQEPDQSFIEATEKLQTEHSCCGINGRKDYTDKNIAVPETCKAFTKGCFEALKDEFVKHKGVIIGVACGVLVFEFILIVFALCLCCKKDKSYAT